MRGRPATIVDRMLRRSPRAVLVAALTAAVAACSTVVAGQPVSVFADPFKVAGMPAVDGPTGLRPGGTAKSRQVSDSDGGKVDQIAAASVSDIEQFWGEAFGASFPGAFHPVKALYSWDSNDYDGTFCDDDTWWAPGALARAEALLDASTPDVTRAREELLATVTLPVELLVSAEAARPDAPPIDFIFTVCDNAAGEVCPIWPGHPATAHWGYADPSEGDGSDAEKLEAFRKTMHLIKRRLELLINLPADKLEKARLQNTARELSKDGQA